MLQRLQKIISAAGIASRRAAEELIKSGRVTVNGKVAGLGDSADPNWDDVRVDGKSLTMDNPRTYIMLNKPRGYVTTLSDEKGRKTVAELVSDCGKRLYPVGRLDMDSEGLLLMTDDGELANKLMHPSHEIVKTYETTVSGEGEPDIERLSSALVIDGRPIKPATVAKVDEHGGKHVLHISISEGRNRQVRKMCQACGLRVHRLRRISEGTLTLGNLPVGKWRELTKSEIHELRKII